MNRFLPLLAGCAVALCSCGADRVAGGSGSETTNTVGVVVRDASGHPMPGARIWLRAAEDTLEAVPLVAGADGSIRFVPPEEGVWSWIEAVVDDGRAGMRVEPLRAGTELEVRVAAPGALRVSGFAPGQSVSLPGLGRRAFADDSGIVRFPSLPSGAVRLRWNGFDAPAPVLPARALELDAREEAAGIAWPEDGSLDSLAMRRFLDLAGLRHLATDSVAHWAEGRLSRLELTGLGLDSLPDAIASLGFLRELDVSGNRLRSLPPGLASLPRLFLVSAAGNPLDSFPVALRGLDSLRILRLDSTGLRSIPSWISDLRRLWYLSVSYNALDSLPDEVADLRHLSILSVYRNHLVALPEPLHQLDSLEELWAESNDLRRLPDSIVLLPRLRVLQVSNNPLDSLPSRLGELSSLRDLRLDGTNLGDLPVSLAALQLENLVVWDLAFCRLDPLLEPWLDSLVGDSWRTKRAASCP